MRKILLIAFNIFLFSIAYSQVIDLSDYDEKLDPFSRRLRVENVDSLINNGYDLLSVGDLVETNNFSITNDGGGALYKIVSSLPTGYTLDTISAIPLGFQKYAILDIKDYVDPSQLGAIYGDLQTIYSSATEAELNTIRKTNWNRFHRACALAIDLGISKVFIKTRFEIYNVNYQDRVEVLDNESLTIFGNSPETSVVEIYPKVAIPDKNWSSSTAGWQFFYIYERANVIFDNMTWKSKLDNRWNAQTYHAILNYTGDPKKIKIVDTVQVWSELWNWLEVGDYIYWDYAKLGAAPNGGDASIITAIDTVNRVITMTDDISTLPSDTSGTNLVCGFNWPADWRINQDTVDRYSNTWCSLKAFTMFLYCPNSLLDPLIDKGSIIFRNTNLLGFDEILLGNESTKKYIFENCNLQGNEVAIACRLQYSTGQSELQIRDSKIFDCGSFADHEAYNGSYVTAGDIWGSGFYCGPTINIRVFNSKVFNNNAAAFRQYSASSPDSKTPPDNSFSVFENSTWYNNQEYHLLTSRYFPTRIVNCWFDNSVGVIINNTTSVLNTYFNCGISMSYTNHPQENDTTGYRINFIDCVFDRDCSISPFGWGHAEDYFNTTEFNNCDFVMGETLDPNNTGGKIDIEAHEEENAYYYNSGILNINNCTIKIPTDVDTSIRFFLEIRSYDSKININNLQIQDYQHKVFNNTSFVNSSYVTRNGKYPINRKIIIKNSDLTPWEGIGFSNAAIAPSLELYNTKYNGGYYTYTQFLVKELPNDSKYDVIYNSKTYNGITGTFDDVFEISPNYNKYYLDGGALKYIVFKNYVGNTNLYTNSTQRLEDGVEVIPIQDMTMTPYSLDNTSNIIGSKAVTLKAGEKYHFTPVNIGCLGGSIVSDTISIAATGTDTLYNAYQTANLANRVIVPGSIRMTSDVENATGDLWGYINGTDVNGIIYPWNSSLDNTAFYQLVFSTPPTGTINLYYDKYTGCDHIGYWKLDAAESSTTLDVTIPETLITSTSTAITNETILVDTSSSAITINQPSTANINDTFRVCDATCNALAKNITIHFTDKLSGSVQDYYLNSDCGCAEFKYVGSTTGWQPVNK